ncbi:hypothetical protein F4775DRAFT_419638 [Biscogniauxia sp. FL1348]|nr:hypothetical protein F4775DRAFT_419638 [Biscogniauxia sp. FL1348]
MSRLIDALPTPKEVHEKKVIVLSRSRVGTFSLYQAFKILGYRPYHMYETVRDGRQHMGIFEEALRCKYQGAGKPYGKPEFDKWLAEFDVIIEIPQFFIEEFIEFYPDAKFILTERSVESWVKSMENTLGSIMKMTRSFPMTAVRWVDGFTDAFCTLHYALDDVMFHGKGMKGGMDDAVRDHLEGIERAKATVPREQLLIAKLEDGFGWEEICPFLGVETPAVRYPKGNAPGEFKKLADNLFGPKFARFGAIAVTAILVPVVSVAVWYYTKRR